MNSAPTRWRDKFIFPLSVFLTLLFLSAPLHAKSLDKTVRQIDAEVLAIDKSLESFTQTSEEKCEGHHCNSRVFYWDTKGRLRKEVEEFSGEGSPGHIKGRYYSGCRLMLVRVTPDNAEKVKNPASIEKYYYQKGKLILLKFGDSVPAFDKEQMAYYERAQHVVPPACVQPVAPAYN